MVEYWSSNGPLQAAAAAGAGAGGGGTGGGAGWERLALGEFSPENFFRWCAGTAGVSRPVLRAWESTRISRQDLPSGPPARDCQGSTSLRSQSPLQLGQPCVHTEWRSELCGATNCCDAGGLLNEQSMTLILLEEE